MRVTRLLPLVALFLTASTCAAWAQSGVQWSGDLTAAQQAAQRDGRLLLIHFYTDWCGPCRRLEQEVFPRDDVALTIAANYHAVKLNAEQAKDAATFYQVDRYPTDIIADPSGQVLLRTVTPQDPSQYIQLLQSFASQNRLTNPSYPAGSGPPVNYASSPLPNQTNVSAQRGGQQWQGGWLQNTPAGSASAAPSSGYPVAGAIAQGSQPRVADSRQRYPNQTTPYGPGSADQRNVTPEYTPNLNAPRGGSFQLNTNPTMDTNVQPLTGQPGNVSDPYHPNGPLLPQDPISTNDAAGLSGRLTVGDLPVALDGYCPVALSEREEWHPGDQQWGMMHRGRVYYFASYDAMQKFRNDPDRYSPVMSGFDVVRYVDASEVGVGKRRHGMWFHGKMYLFADEASLERFSRSPVYYEQRAYEIMVNGRR